MKIRNGFISNSSSSSFIVAFPYPPQSADDVKNIMFGKEEHYNHPYYDGVIYAAQKVAETVWNDICNNEKVDIRHYVIQAYIKYCNSMYDYSLFEYFMGGKHKDYFMITPMMTIKEFFDFISKNKYLYQFEYGDHDEYGCALEHGELFGAMPHIKISNH